MSENTKSTKKGLDGFFGITASGSTMKTEVMAGITTFMAMVYILMVNSDMFGLVIGGENAFGAAYIATAIGAIVGTMLMAFYAKMPLAQASGMGVNAFIVYSLILGGTGLTYANCMVFTLLDGAIFILLTVTGLRQKIFGAIPEAVRHAIPAGIGLFIAFIGFQNAGFIVDGATLVELVNFNFLAGATYASIISPFVMLAGFLAIAILAKKNVKGSILWGILGSAVLYYAMNGIGCIWGDEACLKVFAGISMRNPFDAFGAWATNAVGQVFISGFNFSGYLGMEGNTIASLILLLVTTALSLCICDMFDTIGTCYGACAKGGLLDENGTPLNFNKMLLADAVATCAGAVAGTSTVTTFVESASGVSAGGKTGMTAFVVAIGFFVSMFLSPIAQLIPSAATAAALVWVGVLMLGSILKVDWNDIAGVTVAFVTMIIMVLGYSISGGIGLGILAYIVISVFTGKIKEVTPATWVIGLFFLAYFVLAA